MMKCTNTLTSISRHDSAFPMQFPNFNTLCLPRIARVNYRLLKSKFCPSIYIFDNVYNKHQRDEQKFRLSWPKHLGIV